MELVWAEHVWKIVAERITLVHHCPFSSSTLTLGIDRLGSKLFKTFPKMYAFSCGYQRDIQDVSHLESESMALSCVHHQMQLIFVKTRRTYGQVPNKAFVEETRIILTGIVSSLSESICAGES